ncbi:uncharacterized protein MYCGRDRAFT_97857 [Zymoseptoria tritici IPO323]|uniref:Uncharacterized protein n=1 Tax=Zymoseptoria tritici (strain CBS 115943 / IPO323) TaxID=336722 RepID=F9XRL1_ZYMTI|nr:uncharacterized protein MYCGRDRAFT_97857 [Zymoseptoria tritici IPO323]EGP82053.1 hypothetical protein MYCGRDRAFT_97857 [Zymoseptoria tritici IPO323]
MAELDGKFDPWIVDRNNVARWRHPDIVLGAEPSCDVDDFGSNGSIASSGEESLDAGPEDDDHECPEEPALGLEEEHSIDDHVYFGAPGDVHNVRGACSRQRWRPSKRSPRISKKSGWPRWHGTEHASSGNGYVRAWEEQRQRQRKQQQPRKKRKARDISEDNPHPPKPQPTDQECKVFLDDLTNGIHGPMAGKTPWDADETLHLLRMCEGAKKLTVHQMKDEHEIKYPAKQRTYKAISNRIFILRRFGVSAEALSLRLETACGGPADMEVAEAVDQREGNREGEDGDRGFRLFYAMSCHACQMSGAKCGRQPCSACASAGIECKRELLSRRARSSNDYEQHVVLKCGDCGAGTKLHLAPAPRHRERNKKAFERSRYDGAIRLAETGFRPTSASDRRIVQRKLGFLKANGLLPRLSNDFELGGMAGILNSELECCEAGRARREATSRTMRSFLPVEDIKSISKNGLAQLALAVSENRAGIPVRASQFTVEPEDATKRSAPRGSARSMSELEPTFTGPRKVNRPLSGYCTALELFRSQWRAQKTSPVTSSIALPRQTTVELNRHFETIYIQPTKDRSLRGHINFLVSRKCPWSEELRGGLDIYALFGAPMELIHDFHIPHLDDDFDTIFDHDNTPLAHQRHSPTCAHSADGRSAGDHCDINTTRPSIRLGLEMALVSKRLAKDGGGGVESSSTEMKPWNRDDGLAVASDVFRTLCRTDDQLMTPDMMPDPAGSLLERSIAVKHNSHGTTLFTLLSSVQSPIASAERLWFVAEVDLTAPPKAFTYTSAPPEARPTAARRRIDKAEPGSVSYVSASGYLRSLQADLEAMQVAGNLPHVRTWADKVVADCDAEIDTIERDRESALAEIRNAFSDAERWISEV